MNLTIPAFKKIGYHQLLLYFLIFYGFQPLYQYVFHDQFAITYYGTDYLPFSLWVFSSLFIITVIGIDLILPRLNGHIHIKNLYVVLNKVGTLLFFLMFIGSIYFFIHYGISFRHHHRLREAGLLIQILFFLRVLGQFYIFYLFTQLLNGNTLSKKQKINLFFILVDLILSANASLDLAVIAVGFIMLLPQQIIVKRFLWREHQTSILPYLILLPLGLAIAFFGIANKMGIERAIEYISNSEQIYTIIAGLFARFSTSYMSALIMINEHWLDVGLQFQTYSDHFSTLLGRLNFVFPFFDSESTQISNVNRSNYFLLFKDASELKNSGTSPGLIASIFYVPMFPFNFLFMGIYVVIVLRALNRYFCIPLKKMTLISSLIIFLFISRLFESPLDLLSVIQPSVLYFLLFIITPYFADKKETVHCSTKP